MKLKKIIATALMGAMVLTLGACGNGAQKDAEATQDSNVKPWEATAKDDGSFDRVKKANKILVGLDETYPPMGYRDSATNELVGFDIDMGNEISKRLGIPFEYVPQDWNSIIPSLLSDKIDIVISGMNMFDDRIKQVNFVPYAWASQVILVKADSPDADKIKSVDDLKDKVIGTQLGSTAARILTADGFEEGKNLKLYKAFPEINIDLDNGRVDALAIDSFGAVKFIDSGKYKKVLTLKASANDGKDAMMDAIGIGVRKADGDLQRQIQHAVDEMLVDGTLKQISEKWLKEDITAPLVDEAKARLEESKNEK